MILSFLYKIKEWELKYKSIFTKILFIMIACILVYRINSIRKIIKSIILYFNLISVYFFNIEIDLSTVISLYFKFEKFIWVYILLFILVNCILKIIFYISDKKVKKTIEGKFDTSLYKYLTNKNNNCFLINGDWGIGKTYDVNEFFDKYYKFSKKKVYRISCFGLDTRKLVLNEIKTKIEEKDQSLYTLLINSLVYIPIIGDFLNSVLKKEYSISNIDTNSIFIFDDFERVTLKINHLYNSSKSHLSKKISRVKQSSLNAKEFNEIIDEINILSKNLNEMIIDKYATVNQITYEKYNAVVGLINELIETFNIKVIVICNADVIGYEYINEIFREKLNCITYQKKSKDIDLKNILPIVLKENIFEDNALKTKINDILYLCIDDLDVIWHSYDNHNLRHLKSFFQAYIETIVEYNITDNDIMKSLLYSLFVVFILNIEQDISGLGQFVNGANLIFMCKVHLKNNQLLNALMRSRFIAELYWVDFSISGYWLFYLEKINELNKIYNEFSNYPYKELESKIIMKDYSNIEQNKMLLVHLITLVKERNDVDENWFKFVFEKNNLVLEDNSDNSKEYVEKIFDELEYLNLAHSNGTFINEINRFLYDRYGVSKVESKGMFSICYNNYVTNLGQSKNHS